MTVPPPPGWYADPYGTPGLLRYWDGAQWTQATQPAEAWDESPPAAPAAPAAPADQTGPDGPEAAAPGAVSLSKAGGAPGTDASGAPQQAWAAPDALFTGRAASGAEAGGGPAPLPWQQPMPGGQTPGPPAPDDGGRHAGAPRGNAIVLAFWGGLIVVVVALILVAVLFATGTLGGNDERGSSGAPGGPSGPSSPGGAATSGPPSPVPGGRSPVTGTIKDTAAGLSYDQFGGAWAAETVSDTATTRFGFTKIQNAVVQENYDGQGRPYVASIASGTLPSSVAYKDTGDLGAAAKAYFAKIEPDSYPPGHTTQELESKTYTVSGKSAWWYKVRLSFPTAASQGWNWRTETAVIVLVDRGSGKRPALLYVSMPDSHGAPGDLDLVLGSLKAL